MLAVILSTLEVGAWIGWLATKIGSRDRVREQLINGTNSVRTIQMIDRRLERETRSANTNQRRVASGVSRGIRFFANSRACHLAILKIVIDRWPGSKQKDMRVKLHL